MLPALLLSHLLLQDAGEDQAQVVLYFLVFMCSCCLPSLQLYMSLPAKAEVIAALIATREALTANLSGLPEGRGKQSDIEFD